MAHYLVTGGAGFIGSHLAEELVKRGHRVRVADALVTGKRSNLDSSHRRRVPRGRSRRLGVRAPGGGRRRLRAASGGHTLGAAVGRRSAHLASCERRGHAERAGRRAGRAASGVLVFAGSSSAYGNTPTLPKHEDMPRIRCRRTRSRRSWASSTCGCSPGSTVSRP